ncbi:hypothetical protein [Kitasatospora griseola]|uniref:hypothetical protein n=1 Tax=Kitasatospora griseola TaxID=2064 RepID=UPI0038181FFD
MVFGVADALPARLAGDIHAVLRRYASGDDFLQLFPVPLWSFLHWAAPTDGAARGHAERAHALSLLLHLWDDHLVDAQLPLNFARLHVRGAVWADFVDAARSLCRESAVPQSVVDSHADTYLNAVGAPEEPADLAAYCAVFERQAAVWTVVPRILAESAAAPAELAALVGDFAVAWRLTDDVHDVAADTAAGVRGAVWHELRTPAGSSRPSVADPDAAAARLRARAGRLLDSAEHRARQAGLTGLARELALSRLGLP